MRRRIWTCVRLTSAILLGSLALSAIASGDRTPTAGSQTPAGGAPSKPQSTPPPASPPGAAQIGRGLFVEDCSFCHGFTATGIPGRGPSLVGVGAQASDFYLSTGRMPLPDPRAYPERTKPSFTRPQINALNAYVASLGAGPPIPSIAASSGNLSDGERAFALDCAGCHQIVGRGGIVTGSVAPTLQEATVTEIAEAVRTGPYLMPRFSTGELSDATLRSIARYILYTRHPDDRGGWSLGHIGPIPEGMVAWLFGLASLVIFARVIGERTR
jgi:ubiquinol-cytochrome c reductase cytochrome c subunit